MPVLVLIALVVFASLWVVALMDVARRRRCPACRKSIDREASVCPYCRSAVAPQLGPADRDIATRRAAAEAAAKAPPPVPAGRRLAPTADPADRPETH